MAAPAVPKVSLIGCLPALTARLDDLRADQDPADLSKALISAFTEREGYKMHLAFLAEDETRSKALLEVFDKVLAVPDHDVRIFKKFRQLCGRAGQLPASHIIPDGCIKTTEYPIASGTFGDVWEGKYNDKRVAIKALRAYQGDNVRKLRKAFCKEVAMWKRIFHPNIVPFLGVSEGPAPISMVSEWMPNGNVRDYVAKNPEVSRLQLLLDITRGLSFLHSVDAVHGDLKGDNILVDQSGCARLNDFGFTIIASLNCTETSANGFKGSVRWMAPELFAIEQNEGALGNSTPQSDVFALGMVTFEVFTGQVPYPGSTQVSVMKKTMDGERPSRPRKTTRLGLSDELWAVVQSSLAFKAEDRPPVSAFVNLLERAIPDMVMLEELMQFDANSDQHVEDLRYVFGYGDNTLLGMRESETLVLIEVFDRALNSSLDDGKLRSQCLRGLQKISARCGLLPKSHWIAYSGLSQSDLDSSATERVSDTCKRLMDGQLVAIKTIDPDSIQNPNAFKLKLCTNGIMWKRLKHPNVVSFLGFGSDCLPFSLVYPWMPSGDLFKYLREQPNADKLSLLLDVARGLAYLHHYDIVHGNLTGKIVLVDDDGTARISEYGLEPLLCNEGSSKSVSGDARWKAPEVVQTDDEKKQVVSVDGGKRADVYSFAMIIFETLTGITPFQNESDEEVANRVKTGLRPEWLSNDPSHGLVDALRSRVEACWNHDPEKRPTALEMFQFMEALRKERAEERAEDSQELPEQAIDDDTWDRVDDAPELASMRFTRIKGRKELSILSGSTLVNSLNNRLFPSHHSDESIPKRDPPRGRRARVKKRVGHLLHLSKHGLTTADPAVEKRGLQTEIVDEREENVQISDGSVTYLTSKPIPNGKSLKKVVITVIAKDQGWSSYPEDHGTYRNTWSWFELAVGPPSKESTERWRGEVVRNLHAHGEFKKQTIEITDKGLYEKAMSGDVLTVWALARYPGWKNTVKKVTIRYFVE